jgi:hypothetical protein
VRGALAAIILFFYFALSGALFLVCLLGFGRWNPDGKDMFVTFTAAYSFVVGAIIAHYYGKPSGLAS